MDCRHYKIIKIIHRERTEFGCNEFAFPIIDGKRCPACLEAEQEYKRLKNGPGYHDVAEFYPTEKEEKEREAKRVKDNAEQKLKDLVEACEGLGWMLAVYPHIDLSGVMKALAAIKEAPDAKE
jgi:hypothetical protein